MKGNEAMPAKERVAAYDKRQREKGRKRIAVYLDAATIERIDAYADENRCSRAEAIAALIR